MTPVYTHVVLRPFQAEGVELEIGDFVNASQWRNTERLCGCRPPYLRLITRADKLAMEVFADRTQKAFKKVVSSAKSVDSAPSKKKFTLRRTAQ